MPKLLIEREIAGAGKLAAYDLQGVARKSCDVLDLGWVRGFNRAKASSPPVPARPGLSDLAQATCPHVREDDATMTTPTFATHRRYAGIRAFAILGLCAALAGGFLTETWRATSRQPSSSAVSAVASSNEATARSEAPARGEAASAQRCACTPEGSIHGLSWLPVSSRP
jgi:hypothetical protein